MVSTIQETEVWKYRTKYRNKYRTNSSKPSSVARECDRYGVLDRVGASVTTAVL